MTTPIIDPEFRDAIPALAEEERRNLEDSLVREGCRDALVVWAEEGLLLDGHNRLRLCEQHGLRYSVKEISLSDREAALDWIDMNQLGRRNLTPDVFRLVLGRVYNRRKKSRQEIAEAASRAAAEHGSHLLSRKAGEGDKNPGSENPTKDSCKPRLATRLGDKYGVNRTTVMAAGKLAEAFDEVRQNNPAAPQEEAMQQAKDRVRQPKQESTKTVLKRSAGNRKKHSDNIRSLAAEGHNGPQIAAVIGVQTQYVRQIARQDGITLPEHRTGKTRLLDNTKIIREIVQTIDGTATGLRVTGATTEDLDPQEANELAEILGEALKTITKLYRQLKEITK